MGDETVNRMKTLAQKVSKGDCSDTPKKLIGRSGQRSMMFEN